MPSPRSVLHDIVEQGLNPNHAHSRIGGGGNLRGPTFEEPASTSQQDQEEDKKERKPEPKPGLVKLHCESCSKEAECGCDCDQCVPKGKRQRKVVSPPVS